MPEALETAMAELMLGPGLPPGDPDALAALLARHAVEADDARALLEQGAERLLVYRELARSTLRGALESAIPRTMARLGSVFDEYFARYLAEVGPRSRYLRDVTTELLAFCAPHWLEDPRVPAWAMDLARHEAVQVEVASEPARPLSSEPRELALDAPVGFIPAIRLMRYSHAVHRLPEELGDRTPPAAEPTALLVYRSPEHEVRYLESLLRGQPLGGAVEQACAATGVELDGAVVAGTATLLADLAERGALLGARQEQEGSS